MSQRPDTASSVRRRRGLSTGLLLMALAFPAAAFISRGAHLSTTARAATPTAAATLDFQQPFPPPDCQNFGGTIYCGYNCQNFGGTVYCAADPYQRCENFGGTVYCGNRCENFGGTVYCAGSVYDRCQNFGGTVYCGYNCQNFGGTVYCSGHQASPASPANSASPASPAR